MKKIIFCLFALFCGAGFVWSGNAVAYVSTTGSDANDGTFSRPYRTIRKALEDGGKYHFRHQGSLVGSPPYGEAADLCGILYIAE